MTIAKKTSEEATAISFAGDFGRTAALFAKKALFIERAATADRSRFIEHASYVSASIVTSVAFLESFINEVLVELAEFPGGRLWPERHKLFSRLWALGIPRTASYSILEKYQITLIVSGAEAFDVGKKPYQDAQTVVALRNELIHYTPTPLRRQSSSNCNSYGTASRSGEDRYAMVPGFFGFRIRKRATPKTPRLSKSAVAGSGML